MKGVHFVREAGQNFPAELLGKIISENKSAMGFAKPDASDSFLVVRHNKMLKPEEIQKLLNHDALKAKKTVFSFLSSVNEIHEDDIQPFSVLNNSDGKPIIVAFMNGDFSEYEEANSVHSAAFFCVQKAIIPKVQKAYKIADGDLAKTMEELTDDIYTTYFANTMLGPEGCITLLAANGTSVNFLVNGETQSSEGDGWFCSNAYNEEAAPPADTADAMLAGLDGGGQTKEQPKSKMETKLSLPPSATPRRIMPKRPGHGMEGSKPHSPEVASADTGNTVHPSDDKHPEDSPQDVSVAAEALKDPTAVLHLNVPPGMDAKRAYKWFSKRLPEGMVPKVIQGLTRISCPRSQATPAFIQTYLEQNKLAGLSALKDTAAALPARSVPRVSQPKVNAGDTKEASYPERGEDNAPPSEPKKDTQPHHVTDKPGVITEPVPVFSPNQIEETLAFANSDETKAAVDKHGKEIDNPKGLEKKEKEAASFITQFKDKLSLTHIAHWPLETWLKYATHDPNAAGKAAYWLSLELVKAYQMMDELTADHTQQTETSSSMHAEEATATPTPITTPRRLPLRIKKAS